jgi:quinol-cytochrome oxidoreductase complex cytochrome b subunit
VVFPALLRDPALHPNKLIGVLALFASLLVLVCVPWLDTSSVRSARYRPLYKQFFWIFVADTVILGYVGSQPVDALLFNTPIPLVWLGRIGTLYYFAHFLLVMPLVGLFETPKPLPDSIAKSVLSTTPAE